MGLTRIEIDAVGAHLIGPDRRFSLIMDCSHWWELTMLTFKVVVAFLSVPPPPPRAERPRHFAASAFPSIFPTAHGRATSDAARPSTTFQVYFVTSTTMLKPRSTY